MLLKTQKNINNTLITSLRIRNLFIASVLIPRRIDKKPISFLRISHHIELQRISIRLYKRKPLRLYSLSRIKRLTRRINHTNETYTCLNTEIRLTSGIYTVFLVTFH